MDRALPRAMGTPARPAGDHHRAQEGSTDMTHELRIERLVDATPDVVFDAFVDPESQEEIEAGMPSGYSLLVFEIDLRVGGTWIIVLGPEEGAPYRVRNVFTEINRPRRLACTVDSTV